MKIHQSLYKEGLSWLYTVEAYKKKLYQLSVTTESFLLVPLTTVPELPKS